MDKELVLKKLDLHFKCDCMACEVFTNTDKPCENIKYCEVAQTYFDIIKEIEKDEKT